MPDNDPLLFRVYSEPDGKIYLLYEPVNWRVEVETPLTEQSLEAARRKLGELGHKELNDAFLAFEGESETSATPQQLANRQIKVILAPSHGRFVSRLGESLAEGVTLLLAIAVAAVPIYKALQFSQEKLPATLHLVVLLVFAAILGVSIYMIAAPERLDQKKLKFWVGKNGLPYLACLNLGGASYVLAYLTLWLHTKQLVTLQPCAETGSEVTASTLMHFYMGHVLKLVPFLNLKDTLKWGEPVCYTQARVGALVLLFQALVVLPCINAIRFYLKNRRAAEEKPYKYIYEPGWQPKNNLEP
jgi:hypothetical protein